MKPSEICKGILGAEKLDAILQELTSTQIKAVLKEGHVKAKVPGGYVTRAKRMKIFGGRILGAVAEDNEDLCAELMQQWMLNHRRELLVAFLDDLGVKHRGGETDTNFLVAGQREKIREAAARLRERFDAAEVLAYLHYIAYQQRSNIFDDWDAPAAPPSAAAPADPPDQAPRA